MKNIHPDLINKGFLRRRGVGPLRSMLVAPGGGLAVVSRGGVTCLETDGTSLWQVLGAAEAAAFGTHRLILGDRRISLWDLEGGPAFRSEFEAHHGRIHGLELSPDEEFLLSFGEDACRVWHLSTGERLRDWPEQALAGADWARSRVCTADAERVREWDLKSGLTLRTLLDEPVTALAMSCDGRSLALAPWEASALVLTLDGSAAPRRLSLESRATCLWWDDDELVVGTEEGHIHRAGVSTEAHQGPVVGLVRRGEHLYSAGEDRYLYGWDPDRLEEVVAIDQLAATYTAQALSPDGRQLVLGRLDGTVEWLDLLSGRPVRSEAAHQDCVTAVAFAPRGGWLATASEDCTVALWPARGPRQILDGHDGGVSCLAFDGQGRLLATAGADATLILWDTASATALERYEGSESALESLYFSSQEVLAALYSDGTVITWEVSRFSPG